jgi:hypothetical protein
VNSCCAGAVAAKATVLCEQISFLVVAWFDVCLVRSRLFFWCGSLQGEEGIALESSDQKTRGFVVQIALSQWFSERVH